MLSVCEIVSDYTSLLSGLLARIPRLKVLFTVSPIRHVRDGMHANQLSKATLLLAVNQLQATFPEHVFYFPAYELLLDDFHYPREGRMSRIKTDERTMTQQEALALLADDIHTALEQAGYKGKLSVSVDADIALAGSEANSGIVMSELTEKFDRVYVKVTADQLESVTEAMKAYDVEFIPIVTEATDSGSYLIEK